MIGVRARFLGRISFHDGFVTSTQLDGVIIDKLTYHHRHIEDTTTYVSPITVYLVEADNEDFYTHSRIVMCYPWHIIKILEPAKL